MTSSFKKGLSSSPITRHPVLFEDEWLFIVDKPAGILSHPNPGQTKGCALEGNYDSQRRCFDTPAGRVWLIHRLDQDTSGILLAAKNHDVAQELRRYFEEGKIQKIYLALVSGRILPPSGVWRDHLIKQSSSGMVRSTVARGRPPNAELHYRVKSFGLGPQSGIERTTSFHSKGKSVYPHHHKNTRGFSLVEISLQTGKTHQIRVQAAARANPILGDRVYGDFRLNKEISRSTGLKRLFLHASQMRFRHPINKELLTFNSPLSGELQKVMAVMFKKID